MSGQSSEDGGSHSSDLGLDSTQPPDQSMKVWLCTTPSMIILRILESYPCIQAVENDAYSFLFTVCNKIESCSHMGISDVKRHVHQKLLETQLPFVSSSSSIGKRCVCVCVCMCACDRFL